MRESDVVPVPCRPCGRKLIPFRLARGAHHVRCPLCQEITEISVLLEAGELQVRTRPAVAVVRDEGRKVGK